MFKLSLKASIKSLFDPINGIPALMTLFENPSLCILFQEYLLTEVNNLDLSFSIAISTAHVIMRIGISNHLCAVQ
jgi:hypothetical protein